MKPPAGYPSEGVSSMPCGHSWSRALTVDGAAPGFEYGRKFRRTLPPLAITPLPELSFDREPERELLGELLDRIDFLEEQIANRQAGGFYRPKDAASLRWLLDRARAQIRYIGDIYAKWEGRAERPWSLGAGDSLSSFDSRCKRPGQHIATSQFSAFTCPSSKELEDRRQDRKLIEGYVIDALHHVRCAEYGSAKLELYTQARRSWEAAQKGGAGGFTPPTTPRPHPTAGLGFGDELTPREREEEGIFPPGSDDASEPLDQGNVPFVGFPWPAIPWPGDLPDPDNLPDPADPDSAAPDVDGFGEKIRDMSTGKKVAVAAGAVAALALGWYVLKD